MWAFSFIVSIVVTIIGLFGITALIVWAFRPTDDWRAIKSEYPGEVRCGSVGLLVLWIAFWAFAFFPYEKAYHAYIETAGTVETIDSRLLPSGDGMEEKFVVRFEGSQQEYGCLDTRCALVEPGDYLVLACIKDWDYNATDGYDCKFRRNDG